MALRRRALATLLGVATLAGCAGAPDPLATPLAEPLGPALAIAAPTVAYTPTATRTVWESGDPEAPGWAPLECADCHERLPTAAGPPPRCAECGATRVRLAFATPYRPTVDASDLQRALVERLEARRTLARVLALPPPAPGAPPGDPLAAARAAGAAWLLDLAVEDAEVAMLRTNWLQPVKVAILIVSSILIFPAVDPPNWFLPSEVYGTTLRVRWRLREVEGGAEVATGTFEATAEDAFAAFWPAPSRGFFVIGFLRAPGCLEEEHWAGVAEHLAPELPRAAATSAVLTLEAALRERTAATAAPAEVPERR